MGGACLFCFCLIGCPLPRLFLSSQTAVIHPRHRQVVLLVLDTERTPAGPVWKEGRRDSDNDIPAGAEEDHLVWPAQYGRKGRIAITQQGQDSDNPAAAGEDHLVWPAQCGRKGRKDSDNPAGAGEDHLVWPAQCGRKEGRRDSDIPAGAGEGHLV